MIFAVVCGTPFGRCFLLTTFGQLKNTCVITNYSVKITHNPSEIFRMVNNSRLLRTISYKPALANLIFYEDRSTLYYKFVKC